jgi:phosphoribosylformimino-5-aminoimidazole carboxamide ribotide isomerase
MIIYPAVDLRGGRCVRLQRGDLAAESVLAADPVDAARRWTAEGAEWLHVVNLDGALGRSGAENLCALERILAAVQIPVQFGGGLRTIEDVEHLLNLGVARVILGTVAVRQPQVVQEATARYGAERISVGIDVREGYVAIQGMASLGVRRIIYTDVGRDGMLSGVNVEATARLARLSGLRVIASGGVASLEDVRLLRVSESEGIEGVIIGMALYRGAIRLGEALRIAGGVPTNPGG